MTNKEINDVMATAVVNEDYETAAQARDELLFRKQEGVDPGHEAICKKLPVIEFTFIDLAATDADVSSSFSMLSNHLEFTQKMWNTKRQADLLKIKRFWLGLSFAESQRLQRMEDFLGEF